jgi:RNA polymerase sigma factor (sigma-70 family)
VDPGLDLDAAYRRFGEAVFHRARRLLRDEALAKDALQETFLRAHKYQRSFQGGSMLSWLFTIADRVAFDAIKKRGVVVAGDAAELALLRVESGSDEAAFAQPAARPNSTLERMLQDEQVASALHGVDDDTRQILVHRYVDELTTDAIAQKTGISERTIRRRLEQFFSAAKTRLGAAPAPAAGAGVHSSGRA